MAPQPLSITFTSARECVEASNERQARRDVAGALAALAYGVAEWPDAESLRWCYGQLLASIGRLGEAEVHFREGTVLLPSEPRIWHALANVLFQQGKLLQALHAARRLAALDPASENARGTLSTIAAALHQTAPDEKGLGEESAVEAHDVAEDLRRLADALEAVQTTFDLQRMLERAFDGLAAAKGDRSALTSDILRCGALAVRGAALPEVAKGWADYLKDRIVLDESFTPSPADIQNWFEILHARADFDDACDWIEIFEQLYPERRRWPEEARLRLRRSRVPAVYVAALPKSASVHIVTKLADGLSKKSNSDGSGSFPDYFVTPQLLNRIVLSRAVVHSHVDGKSYNIHELGDRYGIRKLVVHVRDPRQMLISWTHFMASVIEHVDPVQRIHYGLPEDFLQRSFDEQLALNVDLIFPRVIAWVESWLAVSNDPAAPVDVLFTTFEEMRNDENRFFERILEFYDVAPDLFAVSESFVSAKAGTANFRRGETDEWRRVCTPAQIETMNALITDEMRDRFGWMP